MRSRLSAYASTRSTSHLSPLTSHLDIAADPIVEHMTRQQIEKLIAETTRRMKEAAKKMDFLQAAQYRDEIIRLQKEIEL